MRDQADVLHMLAQAALQLKESPPSSSFDDAEHVIDAYVQKRHESESALSRDLDRSMRRPGAS